MVPDYLRQKINDRLMTEIGMDEEVAQFVFMFAFLDPCRDVDFAVETLNETANETLKKGIRIVLEEIALSEGM